MILVNQNKRSFQFYSIYLKKIVEARHNITSKINIKFYHKNIKGGMLTNAHFR